MPDTTNPPPPKVRLSLGITGHRAGHSSFVENETRIAAALAGIFELLEKAVATTPAVLGAGSFAPVRLHSLLANGTDQVAANMALARGWELVAPLPFGCELNEAINALPPTVADARALIAGITPADAACAAQALAIRTLTERARVFELADRDAAIAALYLAKLEAPQDFAKAQLFGAETSIRVALAGRILIEQSDIIKIGRAHV